MTARAARRERLVVERATATRLMRAKTADLLVRRSTPAELGRLILDAREIRSDKTVVAILSELDAMADPPPSPDPCPFPKLHLSLFPKDLVARLVGTAIGISLGAALIVLLAPLLGDHPGFWHLWKVAGAFWVALVIVDLFPAPFRPTLRSHR